MHKLKITKFLILFLLFSFASGCGGDMGDILSNIAGSYINSTENNLSTEVISNAVASTETGSSDQYVAVTSVSITQSNLEMAYDDDPIQLTANVLPNNATNKNVYWSSSHPEYADVDSFGVLTAKEIGETTITATSLADSSKTDSIIVSVTSGYVAAQSVTIDDKSVSSIIVTEQLQLSATVSPDDATQKGVIWESSDSDVASVSSTGLVTGLSEGDTTIKAKHSNNFTIFDVLPIHVSYSAVANVIIEQGITHDVEIGRQDQLSAHVLPLSANQEISWSIESGSAASVNDDGVVTASAIGSAVINACSVDESKCASITINVTAIKEEAKVIITHDIFSSSYTSGTQTIRNNYRQNFAFDYVSLSKSSQVSNTIQCDNASSGINNIGSTGPVYIRSFIINYNSGGTHFTVYQGKNTTDLSAITPVIDGNKYTYNFYTSSRFYQFVNKSAAAYLNSVEIIYDYDGIITAPASVTINQGSSANLEMGATLQLSATVQPYESIPEVTWTSDAPETATVDLNSGLVTAIASGEAIITVTTVATPAKINTITITVIDNNCFENINITMRKEHFDIYDNPPTEISDNGFNLTVDVNRIAGQTNGGDQYIQFANDGKLKTTNNNININSITFDAYKSISNGAILSYATASSSAELDEAPSVQLPIASNDVKTVDFTNEGVDVGPKFILLKVNKSIQFDEIILNIRVNKNDIGDTDPEPGEPGDEETGNPLLGTLVSAYDFSTSGYTDTGPINDNAKLANLFDDSLTGGTHILSIGSSITRVYGCNSNGGAFQNSYIKLGSGDGGGSFTISFESTDIVALEIYTHSWNTSTATTLTINGNTINNSISGTATKQTFTEIDSNTLAFSSNARMFIAKILFYKA